MQTPEPIVGQAYAYAMLVAGRDWRGETRPFKEDGLPVLMYTLPDLSYRRNWLTGWLHWLRVLFTVRPRMPVVVEIHKKNKFFVETLMCEGLALWCFGHELFVCYRDPAAENASWVLGFWQRRNPKRCFVGHSGVQKLHALMKERSDACCA